LRVLEPGGRPDAPVLLEGLVGRIREDQIHGGVRQSAQEGHCVDLLHVELAARHGCTGSFDLMIRLQIPSSAAMKASSSSALTTAPFPSTSNFTACREASRVWRTPGDQPSPP